MDELILIPPTVMYADQIREYVEEFPSDRLQVTLDPDRIPGTDELENCATVGDWLRYVKDQEGKVSWYMAVRRSDGRIVGFSCLRHALKFDDDDPEFTSHAGYSVRPSEQRKGYGSEFLLKDPVLQGTSMRQRFLPKLAGLPDANMTENNLRSLNRFKSHVVLFDSAKSTSTYGLPYMLFANFLRSLGLMDNWIGILEYNLLLDGRYDELKSTIEANEGIAWVELRKNMLKNHVAFKKAVIAMGTSEQEYEESKALAEQHRKEYDATKLREDLQRYLDQHSDTRIVFMIDEVSEAITQEKINLLDLEGIAEALASLGRKVWTIAIAQLKLDDVISMKNVSRNLLTKLRDRFRTTIDIKADEVDVIIKQRLLAKRDAARQELMKYYQKNSGAIRDITN